MAVCAIRAHDAPVTYDAPIISPGVANSAPANRSPLYRPAAAEAGGIIRGEALDEAMSGRTQRGTPIARRTPECFPAEPRDLFWKMDWVADPKTHTLKPIDFDENGDGVIDDSERDAIRGRNTWLQWGGGNEAFWGWLQENGYGLADFLILMDSRKRGERFKDAGLINQPGFETRAKPFLGLYLDGAKADGSGILLPPQSPTAGNAAASHAPPYGYADPRLLTPEEYDAHQRKLARPVTRPEPPAQHLRDLFQPWATAEQRARAWVASGQTGRDPWADYVPETVRAHLPQDGLDPDVYGYPSGIVGLRLLLNPDFFANTKGAARAREYWKERVENTSGRYYDDPKIHADPQLIRPFRVSMSCGFCHIAPHPLFPPQDPENPEWQNLSSIIGGQYWDPQPAFANLVRRSNFLHHFLKSQAPGTIDTSLVSSDHINNTNVINAIFDVPARLERAQTKPAELQSDENLLLPGIETPGSSSRYRSVPAILFPGEDSIGTFGALARVYQNIGLFSEQWARCDNPVLGYTPQRPFRLEVCRANSVYWQVNEKYRVPYLAKFFTVGLKKKVVKSTEPMRLRDAGPQAGTALLPEDKPDAIYYTAADIWDPAAFARDLTQKDRDPITAYIAGRMAKSVQTEMQGYDEKIAALQKQADAQDEHSEDAAIQLAAAPDALRTRLVPELNAIINGASLYPSDKAAGSPALPVERKRLSVVVRGLAKKIEAGKDTSSETNKLNRLILDELFPEHLRRTSMRIDGRWALDLDSEKDRDKGRAVFIKNCVICHSSKQPPKFDLRFERRIPEDWKYAPAPREDAPPIYTLPMDYGHWEDFKKSPAYQDYLRRFRQNLDTIERHYDHGEDPLLTDNFLSSELRIPITLVGTYSGRAMATNAMRGQVWDNYSSETFKSLRSVGKIAYYNAFPANRNVLRGDPTFGTNDTYDDGRVSGGPGYMRPPSLISVWATAPFLHNNALGYYTHDPDIRGRLVSFDDSIRKLLWNEKRPTYPRDARGRIVWTPPGDLRGKGSISTHGDPGYIYRLPVDTYVSFEPTFIRPIVQGLLNGLIGTTPGAVVFQFFSFWWWVVGSLLFLYLALRGRARQAGVFLLLLALVTTVLLVLTGAGGYGGTVVGALMLGMTNLLEYSTGWFWLAPLALVLLGFALIMARHEWTKIARATFWVCTFVTLFAGILTNKFLNGRLKDTHPLAAVLPNELLSAEYKGIHVGPIPRGTPVNLLMNLDPDKQDKVAHALVALLRANLEIKRRNLTGDGAYKVFATEAGPALIAASKCPDMVLDRGHWFGEFLENDDKEALIAFLKTL